MTDPRPSSSSDVRMRGFARRATVESAWGWLDGVVLPQGPERIAVREAAGRVLFSDVVSHVNVPGFSRSMMDGFAVHSSETLGATAYHGLPLTIIGDAWPGRPFGGVLRPGQAVRIMTGAPLPSGADAVIPVERCEVQHPIVQVLDEVSPGKHVGEKGEDVREGRKILNKGRLLRPQDLGVLSSIGCSEVDVVRRPVVHLIVTGNELLPCGSAPRDHLIVDANGPMLEALIRRDGGIPWYPGIIADEPQQIEAALQANADVVLVSGGSSVGQEDWAPLIVARLGELPIHGIAMRPSSPAGMGRIATKLVFLLPGNPVSCLCAYDFFAGRAIRAMSGRNSAWPYPKVRLPLKRKLVSTVGRVDYARVIIQDQQVEPLAISGASILTSTTCADGFVVIAADSEGYPAGAEVDVYLYDLERPADL